MSFFNAPKGTVVTCFIMVSGLCILATCGYFSSEQLPAQDAFVVGMNSGFPPFEILNDQGQLEGFDVDAAQLIAAKLGKKLVIKDMAFDALIMSLKQGKIDAIMSGMSMTLSRLKEISMVHYHGAGMQNYALLFWHAIPAGVTQITDLASCSNKAVCAQSGTIQEEFVAKHSFIEVKHLEHVSDMILDIKFGKSIAAAVDYDSACILQAKNQELKMLLVQLDATDQQLGAGIGIKKENTELKTAIEAIVQQCKTDGTWAKLEQKWFKGVHYE